MDFTLIGTPCGKHGAYTFYKAFKYDKHGRANILALSDFFFVKLWNDSDLVSIGELQLLWEDKNSEQTLASLRLYILPENTPEGRSDFHGEHEVLAITEKVVLRVEDLLTWITDAADWSWGLSAVYDQSDTLMPRPGMLSDNSLIDLTEVDKEKDLLGKSHWNTKSGVVVLSFPRYCRYRGIIKRLEGVHNKWLRTALVMALGGFTVPCRNTRVLYCKDTFDYPDLEGHELLCNHLAPKLKGRPQKKRKLLDLSADSSDSESESSSISTSSSNKHLKNSSPLRSQLLDRHSRDGSIIIKNSSIQSQLDIVVGSRSSVKKSTSFSEEKEFLGGLFSFMKTRQTPINRVPTIGFKELDLYKLWSKVKHLGGFDTVTSSRLWKYVYEEMGGDQSNTSAATCCRRHYERLLLPFERHLTPSRSKVSSLTKLKKFDEISIITKPNSLSVKPPNQNIRIKKKKLEILKEGGLEVTPVTGIVNGQPISADKCRPSVIQHVKHSSHSKNEKDCNKKVSITITPDVGHIFPRSQNMWSVGSPVYGNPKEVLQSDIRPIADEILDLRTKSPYAPVGSNLEITLVPQSSTNLSRGKRPHSLISQLNKSNHTHKSSLSQRPPPHLHRQVHSQRVPSMPSTITNGRGTNIIPSVSITVNHKQKSKSSSISHSSQDVSFPMVDPVYLSAIYSGLFSPFSPTTTPQQLQVYQELLHHRQNIPDSFPRLLQDGSTSISLVNQSPSSP